MAARLFNLAAASEQAAIATVRNVGENVEEEVTDWSKCVSFTPGERFLPTSVDEIKAILQDHDGPFRVLGSLHSNSRIFQSESVIDMSQLPTPRIIAWQTNESSEENTRVTASAHYTLRDFLLELAKHGKTLPATGGTDEQTLAGLLGTNTAPATKHVSIYQGLQSVKYVTLQEDGQAVILEVTRDEDAFNAMVCNLGVVGVLIEVTFDVVDDIYMTTIQMAGKVDDVLTDLAFQYDNEDYPFWRIDWVPSSEYGLVWAAREIPPNPDKPDNDYPTIAYIPLLKKLAGIQPQPFLGEVLKVVYGVLEVLIKRSDPLVVEGPLRNMLPVDRFTAEEMYCSMAEWSFLPADARDVKAVCEAYFIENKWPNLPIEIELVKTDEYYMSPWSKPKEESPTDYPDYLVKFNFMYLTVVEGEEITQFRSDLEAHLEGLWKALVDKGFLFKAHWGKINFVTPEDVTNKFTWDEFKPFVCDKLLNTYLEARLPLE